MMSTFIGQLVGFALIIYIAVRWVVPPVRTMMKNQQEAVRAALEESKAAADKLASADQRHAKAVEDAKAAGVKLTEGPHRLDPHRRAAARAGRGRG